MIRNEFQFLIGRLKTYFVVIKLKSDVPVSIPYRKAENDRRYAAPIPSQAVSIPYRKAENDVADDFDLLQILSFNSL